jgi:hypothetical protein
MTIEAAIGLSFMLMFSLACFDGVRAEPAKPTPDTNPFRGDRPEEKKAGPAAGTGSSPSAAPTRTWSDKQVSASKANCTKALADLRLDFEPLPPIKEGPCGAPAPILVKSIGIDPKVSIEPPATINCAVAVALHKWLKETVQPAAETEFGSHVVKLHNAASYACRNRYGSAHMPLSEHALANALDISDFVLESGEHVTVLKAWPRIVGLVLPPRPSPNPNRLAVAVAAALPAPLPVAAKPPISHVKSTGSNIIEVTKASANPFIPPTPAAKLHPPAAKSAAKSNPFASPTKVATQAPTTRAVPQTPTAKVVSPNPPPKADRLVPAKVVVQPPVPQPPLPQLPLSPLTERKTAFVRKVHKDACATFGTVLGPEANEAHRNHFHFDMKKRRGGYCQ